MSNEEKCEKSRGVKSKAEGGRRKDEREEELSSRSSFILPPSSFCLAFPAPLKKFFFQLFYYLFNSKSFVTNSTAIRSPLNFERASFDGRKVTTTGLTGLDRKSTRLNSSHVA